MLDQKLTAEEFQALLRGYQEIFQKKGKDIPVLPQIKPVEESGRFSRKTKLPTGLIRL